MIRGQAYKRRRAAMIKAAVVLAVGIVLFMPKLEDLRLPDTGSFGWDPFITTVQAGES
jgi:hypothetical protein